jgi:hypothetical protein
VERGCHSRQPLASLGRKRKGGRLAKLLDCAKEARYE